MGFSGCPAMTGQTRKGKGTGVCHGSARLRPHHFHLPSTVWDPVIGPCLAIGDLRDAAWPQPGKEHRRTLLTDPQLVPPEGGDGNDWEVISYERHVHMTEETPGRGSEAQGFLRTLGRRGETQLEDHG